MARKAASWTIEEDVLNWISTKLGSKSAFVNKVLLREMQKELAQRIVMENRPKCSVCNQRLRPDILGTGMLCSNIHCLGEVR